MLSRDYQVLAVKGEGGGKEALLQLLEANKD